VHVVIWTIGDDRYAIESDRVVEVVPVVEVRELPKCPAWVCGLMNYRGTLVPLVDMAMLIADRPAVRCRATRIVVIRLDDMDGEMLGLLVENLESVEHCAFESTQAHPGLKVPDAPYLGAVALAADGAIQLVDVESLLDAEHRALLFSRATAEGE
jgi:chemotaxis-related protein WspB